MKLIGYADANYATDTDNRVSVSGYTFLMNGSAVTWTSKKQGSVAKSTTEAEYVSLSQSASEAVWIIQFMKSLDYNIDQVEINCDNQGALLLSNNSVYHARTKHIDVHFHYLRDLKEKGIITTKYCPTSKMVADILTKGLPKISHDRCLNDLGISGLRGSVGK